MVWHMAFCTFSNNTGDVCAFGVSRAVSVGAVCGIRGSRFFGLSVVLEDYFTSEVLCEWFYVEFLAAAVRWEVLSGRQSRLEGDIEAFSAVAAPTTGLDKSCLFLKLQAYSTFFLSSHVLDPFCSNLRFRACIILREQVLFVIIAEV